MTKREKLSSRFTKTPADFTFSDLCALLRTQGFELRTKGRTSGSRVIFEKPGTSYKIIMHKPHDNVVKRAVLRSIREQLDFTNKQMEEDNG